MTAARTGRVHQVSVSGGGVPKTAVDHAHVTLAGLAGDAQRDTRHHGGPDRAVCLFSLDVIHRLRAEGHPIAPGTAPENLTLAGLEWACLAPGDRLVFDAGPTLEIASYTRPCATIRGSFADGAVSRIHQGEHPGESRLCARVLVEGTVRPGQPVLHEPRRA